MNGQFVLSCESTVDLPYSYVSGRDIPVLFYSYLVDGKEYVDDMGRDPQALPGFYAMLNAGHMPSTSQLNTYQYLEFFDALAQQGDVLHVAFGSGMTASVKNAWEAAEEIRGNIRTGASKWWIPCAALPVTVCWWIMPPICGTRAGAWRKPWPGSRKIAAACTISSIPRI